MKSERLLAVVLTIFLLIGGLWAYQRIDDAVRSAIELPSAPSASEQAAVERLESARARYARASVEKRRALEELEIRREAYRTALEARRPAGRLERGYTAAERRYEAARLAQERALAALTAARPAAERASGKLAREHDERRQRREQVSFLARFTLVAFALALGYWVLGELRRRRSRYFPLAFSLVAAAVVLALILAGDYITDYVDPLELGPLLLSVVGVALTLAAFWALQRYLARRIPFRRVRNGECPFCSFPVRANSHCEGCGRQVFAPCARCSEPRRVGALYCGACGAA